MTEQIPAVPPVPTEPPAEIAPPSEPITPQAAQPEWNARENFERLERALLTLAGQIQGIQPAQPARDSKTATDEELWLLAQQGNRQAFEEYQERIADRRFDKRFGSVQQTQTVQAQLNALIQKYPEFADPNHQLTQRARAFKQVLIQLGEPQNSLKTDLDAMLRAVADSRDVIAPRAPVTPTRAPVTGQIPPSHQAPSAPTTPAERVDADQTRLARQMGVKDPAKALTRFRERNQAGLTRVSPNIAAALDIEERQGNVR